MKTHELKILPQYFKEVVNGNKTFELRKNDRGFEVGDKIILKEYEPFKDGVIKGEYGLYTGKEITKEISYTLEGGQYGLEEGYCILGLKEEGIKLKNIDLTEISISDQIKKVNEEDEEFITAFFEFRLNSDDESKRKHLIEEYWDRVQSTLGLLEKVGISAEEVMKEYDKHIIKIADRPRKKGR